MCPPAMGHRTRSRPCRRTASRRPRCCRTSSAPSPRSRAPPHRLPRSCCQCRTGGRAPRRCLRAFLPSWPAAARCPAGRLDPIAWIQRLLEAFLLCEEEFLMLAAEARLLCEEEFLVLAAEAGRCGALPAQAERLVAERGLVVLRPRRPVPRPPCSGPRRWAAAPSCTLASARRTATLGLPLRADPRCPVHRTWCRSAPAAGLLGERADGRRRGRERAEDSNNFEMYP